MTYYERASLALFSLQPGKEQQSITGPSDVKLTWIRPVLPTVEYMIRLVVGTARLPGIGLLRCCGPHVGPCWLRFGMLLFGCWTVRFQSYAQSAGNVSRDGAVASFE